MILLLVMLIFSNSSLHVEFSTWSWVLASILAGIQFLADFASEYQKAQRVR